jgi:hypothetical protein
MQRQTFFFFFFFFAFLEAARKRNMDITEEDVKGQQVAKCDFFFPAFTVVSSGDLATSDCPRHRDILSHFPLAIFLWSRKNVEGKKSTLFADTNRSPREQMFGCVL